LSYHVAKVRVLICDDDASLRSVIRTLLERSGHEVVAEADKSVEAISLLHRLLPDAVIVDLSLFAGSGHDVLRAAAVLHCPAIVFTAFPADADTGPFANRPIVVEKPDFNGLEAAIGALVGRIADNADRAPGEPVDRRKQVSASAGFAPAPAEPIEEASYFYPALNDAWAGDSLLAIQPKDSSEATLAVLGTVVRNAVRAQDHLMARSTELIALLLGGDPGAPGAVTRRIETAWSKGGGRRTPLSIRSVVIAADEAPSDAFQRLKESST
jgi:CheY-like chemotaxis protein